MAYRTSNSPSSKLAPAYAQSERLGQQRNKKMHVSLCPSLRPFNYILKRQITYGGLQETIAFERAHKGEEDFT